MAAIDHLDRVTLAQVERLRHAIAVAGQTGRVPISLVVDDTPYVLLRSGLQLCAGTDGTYDLWRNETDVVRYRVTLDEAVAMLRGEP